jgi:hypothetical protein
VQVFQDDQQGCFLRGCLKAFLQQCLQRSFAVLWAEPASKVVFGERDAEHMVQQRQGFNPFRRQLFQLALQPADLPARLHFQVQVEERLPDGPPHQVRRAGT